MNKNDGSKNTLKPKATFKRVFMQIIAATSLKSWTSKTPFSNYLFTVDANSKTPKTMV